MQNSREILLVEDEPSLSRTYFGYLRADGYDVVRAETGAAALDRLERSAPDLLLLDLKLPDMDGREVLRAAHRRHPDLPVVVITGNGGLAVAVEVMREGAFDFLPKPIDPARLKVTVRNAVDRLRLVREVERLRSGRDTDGFARFVGSSPEMQAVYATIRSVAGSKASVFVTGESGTGKELVAEALHSCSPRHDRRLVAINCAAIPKDLIESELFGHVRGAFTGATADRVGAARQADGGTLFLDEICEMPVELQAKLLRFIQTGMVQPVGATRAEAVDVRFVAATNRDPLAEVKAGRFREDLYYRLHVVPVHLPPLRQRADDAIEIAQALLARMAAEEGKQFTGFAPAVERAIRAYDWPGNVRQLENVVRNIVVLHTGPLVTPAMLPEPLAGLQDHADAPGDVPTDPLPVTPVPAVTGGGLEDVRPLWQLEKAEILRVLDLTGNDVARTATLLELSPATVYRRLQQWRRGEPG